VRICLLVCVASSPSSVGTQGVRMKGLVRDGKRGEWGSCWKAGARAAPMERVESAMAASGGTKGGGVDGGKGMSWSAYFVSTLLGTQGGDKDGEDDFGEEGWKEVKVETVECEVPIQVWAGNTVFKAMEVVFDV
jgi:RAB6A-GEF complex partner protein 2